MKNYLHFKAKIKNGVLVPYDEPNLSFLEGEVEVTIKKYKKDRTEPQNNFYWGVVIDILSNALGYETDEIHEILKNMFLKKWVDIKGKEYLIIKSTKSLKTDEFTEYIEKIRRWASIQNGIFIPDPNETR